ncbi:suppressor of fused domain protein [Brevibacillus gelatini]|uniref:Suppressor of fused domain protein n=1 Tax=Brevibacillus gelatini TaxID=1655277 RepID=A0A3M8BE12_9BACL|nr:suppressor of fused domain protein [Brevibacillus gelatini]RNB61197.1 suppressor of fused domain protein [Brevibacillus gelatini]
MEVTNQMKEIAKHLADLNGGRPRMSRFYDDNKESIIDVVIMDNKPNQYETTYATVGLCNYDIGYSVDNKPLRVEFIGACIDEYTLFGNILSTCAFNIINSDYSCSPGTIFPDVIKMYYPEFNMKHVMFVSPFLWDEKLTSFDFDDKHVSWLQLIPISDAEYNYAKQNGSEALEDLLAQSDVDVLDVNRDSVL